MKQKKIKYKEYMLTKRSFADGTTRKMVPEIEMVHDFAKVEEK